jgi:hypothetical protein
MIFVAVFGGKELLALLKVVYRNQFHNPPPISNGSKKIDAEGSNIRFHFRVRRDNYLKYTPDIQHGWQGLPGGCQVPIVIQRVS